MNLENIANLCKSPLLRLVKKKLIRKCKLALWVKRGIYVIVCGSQIEIEREINRILIGVSKSAGKTVQDRHTSFINTFVCDSLDNPRWPKITEKFVSIKVNQNVCKTVL